MKQWLQVPAWKQLNGNLEQGETKCMTKKSDGELTYNNNKNMKVVEDFYQDL